MVCDTPLYCAKNASFFTLKTRRRRIEILQFLRMFKTQCDKNDIAEGAALIILPDFLAGAAETTYLNELELGNEGFGGISSYCHAVQFYCDVLLQIGT